MHKYYHVDWGFVVFFVLPGFLLMSDLMLLGSGLWSEPLGFSVRKMCFSIVCIYSLLHWLRSKQLKKTEALAILLILIFLTMWGILVPTLKQISINNAVNDGQLFFGLIFAPAIYSLIESKKIWSKICILVFRLTFLLASLHIGIWLLDLMFSDGTPQLIVMIKLLLEPLRDEADTSVFIGNFGGDLRIFFGSSVFLLVGFYLAVKKFRSDRVFKSIFTLIIMMVAISLTMTRAMILSIPIFFGTAFVLQLFIRYISSRVLFYFFLSIFLALLTIPIVFMSDPSMLAFLGVGRDISDNLRSEQAQSLLISFSENLLIGTGFGSSAAESEIRSESAPWSYEMSILALYMKIGLVGILFLICIFFVFCLTGGIRPLKSKLQAELSKLAALITVVVFCGNTNPYLFSMLGVGLLLFIYFDFRSLNSALAVNEVTQVVIPIAHL